MNREKLYDKWVNKSSASLAPDAKREFMKDLRSLIRKHQQPFIDALDAIIYDVAQKIESEVSDAKTIAKRLG